ncbi:MAG: hypothetical protein AAF413_04725 [Patescibacteria group bacterium]
MAHTTYKPPVISTLGRPAADQEPVTPEPVTELGPGTLLRLRRRALLSGEALPESEPAAIVRCGSAALSQLLFRRFCKLGVASCYFDADQEFHTDEKSVDPRLPVTLLRVARGVCDYTVLTCANDYDIGYNHLGSIVASHTNHDFQNGVNPALFGSKEFRALEARLDPTMLLMFDATQLHRSRSVDHQDRRSVATYAHTLFQP